MRRSCGQYGFVNQDFKDGRCMKRSRAGEMTMGAEMSTPPSSLVGGEDHWGALGGRVSVSLGWTPLGSTCFHYGDG